MRRDTTRTSSGPFSRNENTITGINKSHPHAWIYIEIQLAEYGSSGRWLQTACVFGFGFRLCAIRIPNYYEDSFPDIIILIEVVVIRTVRYTFSKWFGILTQIRQGRPILINNCTIKYLLYLNVKYLLCIFIQTVNIICVCVIRVRLK